MSRKLCSIVLCLILVLGIPMGTLAAQQANIIQNVWIQDTGMKLICADAEESGGEYRVQVDGTDVPVTPSTVAEDGMAVTVFCLVDTSGSISQFKLKLIQETLQELSNSLGSERWPHSAYQRRAGGCHRWPEAFRRRYQPVRRHCGEL